MTKWTTLLIGLFFAFFCKDGKYVVLPSGELQIRNVGPEDGFKTYKCRTKHRLTGKPINYSSLIGSPLQNPLKMDLRSDPDPARKMDLDPAKDPLFENGSGSGSISGSILSGSILSGSKIRTGLLLESLFKLSALYWNK